ncbi:MAG TPA: ABC transporter permease [Bryobacteraceae bacterium]
MKATLAKWRSLLRPARTEAELEEELAFHLQEEMETRQDEGLSPAEAQSAARRSLGNLPLVKEEMRAAIGLPFLETALQDIRIAARALRRGRGFGAIAVLTLGIGIGASTAVFGLVNAVVLRPLPCPDPGRLVALSSFWKAAQTRGNVSQPDFEDWLAQNRSFESMAYYSASEAAVVVNSESRFATVAEVSSGFFRVFGVRPAAGRVFRPDVRAGIKEDGAVVTQAFALAHFGGGDAALGKIIITGGRAFSILGVMPAGFSLPTNVEIWTPARPGPDPNRGSHSYQAVGRLRAGVTVESAESELAGICDRLEKEYPGTNYGKTVLLQPLGEDLVRGHSKTFRMLLLAVFLLLLVACGNVSSLLLAKGAMRMRELGVRIALGATRQRIVRQLVTECLVLGLASGLVGVVIARYGTRSLVALAPIDVPRLNEITFDLPMLLFAAGLTLLACLIFGLVPAIRMAGIDVNRALKQGCSQVVAVLTARVLNGLVIVQVAVSVVLLSDAGLLIRSFAELSAVPLGFDTRQVLVMETGNSASDPEAAALAIPTYETLLKEAAAIPGIVAVGASRTPPGRVLSQGAYEVDGAADPSATSPQAIYSVVSPGTFRALGIPLLRGRDFSPQDSSHAMRAAIVNDALARRSFPGVNPVGRSIAVGLDGPEPMTIVGVVGDIRQDGPAREGMAEVYMPYQQHPLASTAIRILVRTSGRPESVMPALLQTVLRMAPAMPVRFTTMEARISENLAAPRFRTILLALIAAISLVMTMAAVYSVMSLTVAHRFPEIGLRTALGAESRQVMLLILPSGLRLALIGAVFGIAGAAVSTRFLGSLLFGIKVFDPITYAAVAAVMAMVTAGACWAPARRAARIDPAAALRNE